MLYFFSLLFLTCSVLSGIAADEIPARPVPFFLNSRPIGGHVALRVVEGRPKIENGVLSVATQKTADFVVFSWPRVPYSEAASPASLDPGTAYRFTIAGRGVHQNLIKIEKGTNTIYDGSICEIHKKKMALKDVPIRYGLIIEKHSGVSGEELLRLENEEFPHYREEVLGGCVVSPNDPQIASLWVCSDCKNAHATWLSKQEAKAR